MSGVNMDWLQEDWATDAMKEIAVSWLAPKPKEEAVTSPQLGAGITFGDWVIPVVIIAVVAVVLLFVFKVR